MGKRVWGKGKGGCEGPGEMTIYIFAKTGKYSKRDESQKLVGNPQNTATTTSSTIVTVGRP